jgi:hypothetical protein
MVSAGWLLCRLGDVAPGESVTVTVTLKIGDFDDQTIDQAPLGNANPTLARTRAVEASKKMLELANPAPSSFPAWSSPTS